MFGQRLELIATQIGTNFRTEHKDTQTRSDLCLSKPLVEI